MAAEDKSLFQSLGSFKDMKGWLVNHKLTALGGAWASAVGLSFAAQLSQNTPMTLKIFQTRIYAQAFTVAALCAAAAITVTEDDEETRKAKKEDIFTR